MTRFRLLALAAAVGALIVTAFASATTSIDVQANDPQVAGDATSNTTARFPTNKSNEPAIAVNPLNSQYLVAGANDEQLQPACGPGPVRGATAARNDCSFFPGVGTDGVYTSADGGSTWTNRGLLPGYSEFPGQPGTLVSDGDPRLAYGPAPDASGSFASARANDAYVNGTRVYYAGLASYAANAANGQQAPELLGVSTSDDNGITWGGPSVAASSSGFIFNDHEDIWADDSPSSPYFGRVYVSWTQFRDLTSCAEPVMIAYSDDGGRTWSGPNQLTAAHNCGIGGRQASNVRTDGNGNVYVSWIDSDQSGAIQAIAVSKNGGVTFTHTIKVANVDEMPDPIPGANFRDGSEPSLAVDQSSGAVYLAWSDLLGSTLGQMVVARSTDGARTWTTTQVGTARTGFAFFQGIDVAPNGRVDLGYQALKARDTSTYGTGNATVASYYSSSTDGGVTWSRPTRVSAFSDPAASAQNNLERQFWGDYNSLVSSNGNAWFIYTDTRNGVGCAAVDAYQHAVDGSGPAAAKPAPEDVCPAQYGNSDSFVSKITP